MLFSLALRSLCRIGCRPDEDLVRCLGSGFRRHLGLMPTIKPKTKSKQYAAKGAR